jgi:uncharacterized protein YeaO (DUF488 family)
MAINLKRVYDEERAPQGVRFLVERLWPRGIKKADLRIDGWLKDPAPGAELRKRFSHDPARWHAFRHGCFAELDSHPDASRQILDAARQGPVTLLYSSHDTHHNNAVALKQFLDLNMRKFD